MAKNSTYGWIVIVLIVWTGMAGAFITAPLAGTWLSDELGFSTTPQPEPIDERTASLWRITTKNALSGADLTTTTCDLVINGKQVGDPALAAGYIEVSASPVRQGDQVQMQIALANYYTIVKSFTVPKLGPLVGGQTYYTLYAAEMFAIAHADATIGATYAGADIDAAAWDITAGQEYSGVTITLNLDVANMADKAYGPEPYTEIVGDRDRMSKFIKFDCNDSGIIIKDVKLEGAPLKLVWTTFADGSDYQAIYEYEQMLIQESAVSGDGIYDLTFSFTPGDAAETVAVSYHVGRTDGTLGVDFESAQVGSAGSADETATITTE